MSIEKTSLENIKTSIIRYFGTDFDINSRKREVHYLRCLYFKLPRENTFLPYSHIGASLDHKKDHATVIHSMKVFEDTIKQYKPKIIQFYDSFQFIKMPVVCDVDLCEGKIITMLETNNPSI